MAHSSWANFAVPRKNTVRPFKCCQISTDKVYLFSSNDMNIFLRKLQMCCIELRVKFSKKEKGKKPEFDHKSLLLIS